MFCAFSKHLHGPKYPLWTRGQLGQALFRTKIPCLSKCISKFCPFHLPTLCIKFQKMDDSKVLKEASDLTPNTCQDLGALSSGPGWASCIFLKIVCHTFALTNCSCRNLSRTKYKQAHSSFCRFVWLVIRPRLRPPPLAGPREFCRGCPWPAHVSQSPLGPISC